MFVAFVVNELVKQCKMFESAVKTSESMGLKLLFNLALIFHILLDLSFSLNFLQSRAVFGDCVHYHRVRALLISVDEVF